MTSPKHCPPVYKGSLTLTQPLAEYTHDIGSFANMVNFNAVRLDAVNICDSGGNPYATREAPYSVVVDNLRPLCYDFIGAVSTSRIGLAPFVGYNFNTLNKSPMVQTSHRVEKLRSPVTITYLNALGNQPASSLPQQLLFSATISFWETKEPVSTVN